MRKCGWDNPQLASKKVKSLINQVTYCYYDIEENLRKEIDVFNLDSIEKYGMYEITIDKNEHLSREGALDQAYLLMGMVR